MNSFFDDLRFYIDEENLFVRAEQLRARLKLLPLMLVVQIVIEPLYIWLMWDIASHRQLMIWLSTAYLLHLAEMVLWIQRREDLGNIEECQRWSQDLFNFALVFGMMWGVGTMFFFPSDLLTQVLLVCVLMGLTAGAATMNSMHPPSFYAYVLSLMVPLTFRVMVEQDETHIALGAMLLLFLLVMLSSGHFLSKFIMLSLRQRFENESLAEQLASMNGVLEHKVEERTAQLQHKTEEVAQIRDVTIMAMASLAETRDNETGNHLKRTQNYIRALALRLRHHPHFKDFLTEDNIESLYKLAPLHDIGKVGIPDAILLKKGKLTMEEFEIMKTHPLLGGNAIAMAESGLPTPNRFLHIAREIATGHHEKWDGSGYPLGLKGKEIPISARLMAVADVYDALISRRIYKEALSHEDAMAYILQGEGNHFDPDVVEAFQQIQDEFRQIAGQYQD
ncbi:HD-GYP domain-containing protein [Sideroxydans lithotrophicus]|uniref:Metal dependent phosphohydrolase n=1 Tax=Sideroxydans lithotrophicus (strain ES-1) TaxID=580332 RepID=D5CRG4_SIDLE|nr:HD domain-containing phosphohydrolase [Sideroxydans lithotrophicus]ADE11550.1 metal dependent phosphohydrolase [Sideroxydans lithotrophicus ES-1]